MFKKRLISGIILLVITILLVVTGGNLLFAFTLFISLIGLMELYRVVDMNKKIPAIFGYIFTLGHYGLIYFNMEDHILSLVILFLLLLMTFYVFSFPKYKTDDIAIVFFGLFYVSILLSYIYQVRVLDDGAILIWLVFIGAWGSDTCAYCVGMLFGKHKLFPKLSPKKSTEGHIGGVVGAALIGFIFGAIFQDSIIAVNNPRLAFTIICGVSSLLSQIGDLAASAIKRNYEIKDYGRLIPGHGGILDRFDSILFTAPVVYYLTHLFIIK